GSTTHSFFSRSTVGQEQNWSSSELGCGDTVWAVKKLRHYLWETKFGLFTDHVIL
ncbi:unnamed protein product, partial [Discosporangium mesarthrocarpum]